MTYVVGDAIYQELNVGVAGEIFTRETNGSRIDGILTAWDPTITDLTDGWYGFTYTPSVAGIHTWRGEGDFGDRITINWDVEADVSTPAVDVAVVGGTTRRTIRQAVADRLDDLKVLTASVNSGGYGTLRDDIELTDAQNAYLGSQAMPISGTALNLGRIVRVVGSSASTHTITVTPDLPAMPQEGDEWELVNLNGKGWRFQDYHRFINQVFADASEMARVSITATISDGFPEDDPELTIPDQFTHITGIYVVDGEDLQKVPRAKRPGPYGQGYWIDSSTRTIRIEGGYRGYGAGADIVLRGMGRQEAMTSDSDTTTVDLRWLVPEVASRMAASAALSDTRRQAQADRLGAQAREARDLARPPRSANTWKV